MRFGILRTFTIWVNGLSFSIRAICFKKFLLPRLFFAYSAPLAALRENPNVESRLVHFQYAWLQLDFIRRGRKDRNETKVEYVE